MKKLSDIFGSKKKPPMIVVSIDNDNPARGDTHGYIGMAKRIASMTGGKFFFLDDKALEDMYPHIWQYPDEEYECRKNDERLKQFFEDHGAPDYLFSRQTSLFMQKYLEQKGKGVIISAYNEHVSENLGFMLGLGKMVPHHLTPEILAHEGYKFATEYQELPRPFIGVVIANLYGDQGKLARKLGDLQKAYKEATIFVTSCHRTGEEEYTDFMGCLRAYLKASEGRVKLVDYNYKFHETHEGMDQRWNPYAGILHQSDHLILAGESHSMVSEMLSTGKIVHKAQNILPKREPFIKNLFDYAAGAPLETPRDTAPDATEVCARKIIGKHDRHTSYWMEAARSSLKRVGVHPVYFSSNYKSL